MKKPFSFFLFFILLSFSAFSYCNQDNIEIIRNINKIYVQLDKLPKEFSIDIGNPNCFDVLVSFNCQIEDLECIEAKKSVIIPPNEIYTAKFLIKGNIPDKAILHGTVKVSYLANSTGAAKLSINVEYPIEIEVSKPFIKETSGNFIIENETADSKSIKNYNRILGYIGVGLALIFFSLIILRFVL